MFRKRKLLYGLPLYLCIFLTGCITLDSATSEADSTKIVTVRSDAIYVPQTNTDTSKKEITWLQKAQSLSKNVEKLMINLGFLEFEPLSVQLSELSEAQIMALLPALEVSKKIQIKGFCYSGDVENARPAAQRRAEVVQALLVKHGIKKERIKISTDTWTRQHAVEIRFSNF